jgi:hypothetical protein
VVGALEFFSVKLLLGTLFDPFRQIDAGGVRGALQVQMRAFFDRTFSRFVGFFVRTAVILFGLTVACTILIVGVVQLLVWPLLPVLPVIGAVLNVLAKFKVEAKEIAQAKISTPVAVATAELELASK